MYGLRLESVGVINIIGNQSFSGESLIRPTNLTSPGSNNTEVNIINNFFCIYRIVNCGALRCYFTTIALVYSADNSYTPANITTNISYNSLSLGGFLYGLFEYSDATGWDIRVNNGIAVIKNNIILNNGFITIFGPYFGTGSYIKVGPGVTAYADYNCFRYLAGVDAIWINGTDNSSKILEDEQESETIN
ncbi:MAG: hypothetical protein IPL53_20020 [Ignavibacteria bacterium]|nr:hypothetical protein [Ignavibacteria bacterium]